MMQKSTAGICWSKVMAKLKVTYGYIRLHTQKMAKVTYGLHTKLHTQPNLTYDLTYGGPFFYIRVTYEVTYAV